jgi:hypothetical protein
MRRRTWMSAMAAAALLGCSSPGDVDLLESQLRQKEDMIADLDGRLAQMRQEMTVQETEIASLREQARSAGQATLVAEQAATLARAEKIAFHRLLTSGLNHDDQAGDERLSVLLTPLDGDGELIKLPGTIELTLFDYTLPENQQKIGQWTFPVTEAKEAWHRGFTASGYLFELPWQTVPRSKELTLHGRMTAPDGRQFDATTTVAVRLAPNQTASTAARRLSKQPITQTAGTAGRAAVSDVDEAPSRNGTPTSDRYKLGEIPVRR